MKHIPNLLEALKHFYGITLDPREAGYITPEGEYLDFSNRHLTGKSSGKRLAPHYKCPGVNFFNGYCLLEDHPELAEYCFCDKYLMSETGCIRVNRDDWDDLKNYAQFIDKVTIDQVKALAGMFLGKCLIIEGSCDNGTVFQDLRIKDLLDWFKEIGALKEVDDNAR